MKKIAFGIVGILAVVLLTWIGSMVYASWLTALYADEFHEYCAENYDEAHFWDEPVQLRVVTYHTERAKLYIFNETGGEMVELVKTQEGWSHSSTIANWSSKGNADDYFIWPYFKNYVP